MRKHLAILATIALVALVGCSPEPDYQKQSEVPSDDPSVSVSESADPTQGSTATESAAPEEQPTTTTDESPDPATAPAACKFDDSWSTAPVKNFGNMAAGDIGSDDTAGKIYDIDIGKHDCFDRIVIRVDTDQEIGLRAEYVDVVRTPGKGDAVNLLGDADLQILVQAWVADANGLYSLNIESASWPVLHQVVQAGSFEGQTTIGVGVDHKAPFKVYYLPADDDTMRIVIDIAHQ